MDNNRNGVIWINL